MRIKSVRETSRRASTTNGKLNGHNKGAAGSSNGISSSWILSIAFWSFCMVAQYYLLSMYHSVYLTYQETGGYTNDNDNLAGLYHPGLESPRKRTSRKAKPKPEAKPKARNLEQPQADGTFNGYPIYKLKAPPTDSLSDSNNNNNGMTNMEELYSQFQCVGETWHDAEFHRRSKTLHEQSWMFRSCRFQVFCYDTSTQDYVLYLDPEKHQGAHTDHHYHHNNNGKNKDPHPNPHIQKILDQQGKQNYKERNQIANPNHSRNTTTEFKHPTFIDDTSTVYRNHTVVVDSNGDVRIGDTENGKHYGVSIGSINGKWGLVDGQLLKWFPEIRWGPVPGSDGKNNKKNDNDYEVYTLPPSVAMIPFHSLAASNPGHLVWDDLLPMYTLLDMFGFIKTKNDTGRTSYSGTNHPSSTMDWTDILPIRYVLPGLERGLWAGCDWTDEKQGDCHNMLKKFGILMGTRRSYSKFHPNDDEEKNMVKNPNGIQTPKSAAKLPKIPITTNREVELVLKGSNQKRLGQQSESETGASKPILNLPDIPSTTNEEILKGRSKRPGQPTLICAKNGMAGYGSISDHLPGMGHGWASWDYLNSYNSGRGGQLWEFRNYMVHNLFEKLPKRKTEPPAEKTAMRRRLLFNKLKIEEQKPKHSVLLEKDHISTYPPSSITDFGPDEPLVVLFSAFSSQRRGGSMEAEALWLKRSIEEAGGVYPFLYGRQASPGEVGSKVEIIIENHTFSRYTLEEQIQMASRAAAFVTYCGGGAITGSFLPKGGAMHLYYGEREGIEHNRNTGKPARLDWDFFNSCGYLHVKWLPYGASSRDGPSAVEYEKQATEMEYKKQALANVDLLRDDLRRIHQERVQHSQQKSKE